MILIFIMKHHIISLLLMILFVSLSFGEKKQLYIGTLLELSESRYAKYANIFQTVFEYAFQKVNNRSDILDEYECKMIIEDTKGNVGLAAKRLIEMLEENPPKVAIIGPTLFESVSVTGQIVPFYNIIEISYTTTTTTTTSPTDQTLFPTIFQINQVSDAFNLLTIKVMKSFGWTRVGFIAHQEKQIENFHDLLLDNNITLATSAFIVDISNFKDILTRFKKYGVRIIVGTFSSDVLPYLFCEAYQQGMFGNSYVWILTGQIMFKRLIDKNVNIDKIGCTMEQLIQATEGLFTTDYQRDGASTISTISGQYHEEAVNDLKMFVSDTGYEFSSELTWIYDIPWALAIGLNNSVKYLEKSGLDLHKYNYSDKYLEAVMTGMREVQFQGISGEVAFDKKGCRLGAVYLKQQFYDKEREIAWYDKSSDVLTWYLDSSSIWKGNDIPRDRFTYKDVLVGPSSICFALIVSLSCFGFVLSFAFLSFHIIYRKNSSIKMSSPMLNNVVIVGCLLVYLEILFKAITLYRNEEDVIGNSFCMVRIWLLSLGFSILFGAVFSKTYRVYALFRDYKMKLIKDNIFLGMLGIMLLIDVIILVPWTLFFPLQIIRVPRVKMNENEYTDNMIYSESYLQCYHENSNYLAVVLYAYKGIFLACGVLISWEIRRFTISMPKDSMKICFSMFNFVIACTFGVSLANILPVEQMIVAFALESCLLFFCTTSIQCIIFVPKIKGRNKVHGHLLCRQQTTDNLDRRILSHELVNRHDAMKREITTLRMKAAHEAIAISKLRKKILHFTGNVYFYKCGDEYVVFRKDGSAVQQ